VAEKPHIQLGALHELARALAGGEFRARVVLERACAAVAGGFGFERVGIVRYIAETATLIPFAAHGLTDPELEALPAALGIGDFGAFQQALAANRAIFVENPDQESAIPAEIATACRRRGRSTGSWSTTAWSSRSHASDRGPRFAGSRWPGPTNAGRWTATTGPLPTRRW